MLRWSAAGEDHLRRGRHRPRRFATRSKRKVLTRPERCAFLFVAALSGPEIMLFLAALALRPSPEEPRSSLQPPRMPTLTHATIAAVEDEPHGAAGRGRRGDGGRAHVGLQEFPPGGGVQVGRGGGAEAARRDQGQGEGRRSVDRGVAAARARVVHAGARREADARAAGGGARRAARRPERVDRPRRRAPEQAQRDGAGGGVDRRAGNAPRRRPVRNVAASAGDDDDERLRLRAAPRVQRDRHAPPAAAHHPGDRRAQHAAAERPRHAATLRHRPHAPPRRRGRRSAAAAGARTPSRRSTRSSRTRSGSRTRRRRT